MAEMLIKSESLTSIADKIRVLSGTEEAMGLDDMAEHVGEANTDIATEAGLIEQIASALEGKGAGGGEIVEIKLQSKTVTPTTSTQTVTADSGYDGLDEVTVNAMTTVTQATPSITVSTSGLITSSSTQSAGYVSAGTKSATKQLTTKAAATITPSTSNQTIAAGTYLTGVQTIKGDSNLVPSNIVNGKTIFGVTGNAEVSDGEGSSTGVCPQLTITGVGDSIKIGHCLYSTNNGYADGNGNGLYTTECIIDNIDINLPIFIEISDSSGMFDGMTGNNAICLIQGGSFLVAKCTSVGENSTIQLLESMWGWG